MSKHLIRNNELLLIGIGILIIGIVLTSYSFSTYAEIKQLNNKIDFETVDKNLQISSTDKYYKYMEYSDYLYEKLKANKNIPLKRVSCTYLDYAQHNAVEMYYLTKNKMTYDDTKINFSTNNIQSLYDLLGNYKNCKQSAEYKKTFEEILKDAQNFANNQNKADERLNEFLYGTGNTPQLNSENNATENTVENSEEIPPDDNTPNYIDTEGKAQTLTPEQIEYINKQQAQSQN